VTELFEARRPKDPAVLAEIEGQVEFGEKKRNKRTVIVKGEGGKDHEHLVPPGAHLRPHRGDHVDAGEPLSEGPLVPQDILRIKGEEGRADYLLPRSRRSTARRACRSTTSTLKVILAQMMRKVHIDEPGDSDFLPGAVVDKFRFRSTNMKLMKEKKKPAEASPLLLGVTKASLQSDSFISAASFQETTKVLTEAALAGRKDQLIGLKENVILGHLVPTGTGFSAYQRTQVRKNIDLQAAAAELLAQTQGQAGPTIVLEGEGDASPESGATGS
jgi:DNA-directed RNA polymerase subunit beta'